MRLRRLHVKLFATVSAAAVICGVVGATLSGSATARPQGSGLPVLTYAQLSRVMSGQRPGPAIGAAPSLETARAANSSCQAPYGWLTTSGPWIVEASDPSCKIRLTGVTWYGMQTTNDTFAGLNFASYKSILDTIKALGMNSVRIPFANNVIENNPAVKDKELEANPDLQGRDALDILDAVVQYAKSINLMVILDDHFAFARSASDTRNLALRRPARRAGASPTPGITRAQWIADWLMLAQRYINDDNVIGFDLFNEPHTQFVQCGKKRCPWTLQDYLRNGATWGPCTLKLCGTQAGLLQPSSDWPTAAEAAGNAVLAVNRHLLMFVEGVQLYPDPALKHWVEPYWWGSILKGVATDPVVFDVKHQLVYSPHEWGPWKCCGLNQEFYYNTSYKSIVKIFTQNWAYILSSKNPKIQAPIWLGEFNTCNSAQSKTKWTSSIKSAGLCVSAKKHGSEGQWFSILIQFLQKNPEIGWSYYPLNATNALDQASNNSLLGCPGIKHKCKDPWAQPRLSPLMQALRSIEKQPK